MEQADGVGAAADAGDQRVGQAAFRLQHLLARLVADHALEVAHHRRIGVRAGARCRCSRRCRRHWSTQSRSASFIASLSVRAPDCTGTHLGAEQLHAEDVGLLPLDVDRAHVDDALQAEARADGGGGDAVLAGAGLGDDARLAHAPGQQDLAEHVVDLVRAGVVQLLALEIDLRAAEMLGQPLGEIERARAADVVREQAVELGVEGRVGLGLVVGLLQLEDQRHQRLGDEAAAEDAEMAALVGAVAEGIGLVDFGHAGLLASSCAREGGARGGDEGRDSVARP